MSETIVEEYSGSARRGPENYSADGEHMRIILVKENGETEELFKGKEFDANVFRERMKRRGFRPYVDSISRKKDGTYQLDSIIRM